MKKYHGDLSHVDEEYRSLVDRLTSAERSIGYFSGAVRADYERLCSMVQELSYIQAESDRRHHDRHH